MKLLVTGAAGFIGANLVHYLLGDAEKELGAVIDGIISLDKLTYAGNIKNLDPVRDDPRHLFVHGDIGDRALVEDLLRGHQVDGIMNLAAESHVDRSIQEPEAVIQSNVVGTQRLLEAYRDYLAERGLKCCQAPRDSLRSRGTGLFLHVSTDEVFGALGPNDPAFRESTPYDPGNPYSASKAASDHIVRAYHNTYGMPAVVTGCSNNYGPYQFPEKLVPLMIRRILSGEVLPVYGDGSNVRDWLHVRDHVRGLAMALVDGRSGETYLMGGKCEMKNIDVVRILIETISELVPDISRESALERVAFVADRPGHDYRYAIDPSKIERELGWRPKESLESGMRRTVEWYLNHREWLRPCDERGSRMSLFEP